MLIGNERAPRAFNGSESQRPREQNSGAVQGAQIERIGLRVTREKRGLGDGNVIGKMQ